VSKNKKLQYVEAQNKPPMVVLHCIEVFS